MDLIARLVWTIIVAVNAAAAAFGFNPLDVDQQTVYMAVSFFVALVTWAWGFWKNNDFTEEARKATAYMHDLKAAKHSKE